VPQAACAVAAVPLQQGREAATVCGRAAAADQLRRQRCRGLQALCAERWLAVTVC
jgi:hypothetical protein